MKISAEKPYEVIFCHHVVFGKLGKLVQLFKKYLVRRLQLTPVETTDIEALGLLVGALASTYRDTTEVFEPDDLFHLLVAVLHYPEKLKRYLPYVVEINFNSTIADHLFKSGRCVQVCYLGEFVYYCRTLDRHPNCIVAQLLMESNIKEEILLIREIRMECTAELGISLFNVLRNYFVSMYDSKYSELILDVTAHIDNRFGFESCYDHYSRSLKEIDKFPELSDYLSLFLTYLSSNASLAHWHFNNYLLQSAPIQNGLRDKAYFLSLVGTDRYLIKLLQFVLDMFCFLRSQFAPEGLTLNTFEKLPEFYLYRWRKCDYSGQSITNHIFEEVTQILDFLIFSNFMDKYDERYNKLCKDIGDLITNCFSLNSADIDVIQKLSLFPFFGSSQQ